MDLQLYRQLEAVEARGFDVRLELAQDRRMRVGFEARGLEVGRQSHLKNVHLFFGRTESLRIGAAQRHEFRIAIRPHRRVGVAGLQRIGFDAGDAREIRQRRHVHDRHAWQLGLADRIEQLAHASGAVLRLLHAEHYEVVAAKLDRGRNVGRELAGQLARIDFDQALAALHREAHAGAFLIDEFRLGGNADELHVMAREQQLGREQRAVRSPKDQDVVGHWSFHDVK